MKNLTIIASLTFQALQVMDRVDRFVLLTQSRNQQKSILKTVRFLIASGKIRQAKAMLYAWRIEHASYKLVQNLQTA